MVIGNINLMQERGLSQNGTPIMTKPFCLLLIHGFGGSTKEVQPLALQLESMGLPVFMARLAGHHGIEGKAIDNISYKKWIDSVRIQLHCLEKSYSIIPVGFSMGGLIAVTLNIEQHFEGMVFINTPIYFWNLSQVSKNLILDFKNAKQYYFRSAGSVTPYTMSQFLRLLAHSHHLFKQVNCVTLVVQAQDDDSVWPASANFICKNVQKTTVLYKAAKGGHQVLSNPDECKIIAKKVATLYQQLNMS